MAAERRDPEMLHRLDASTPEGKLGLNESEQFGYNKEFHSVVVEASTNLTNWQPIWTNTPPGAFADFVDPEWRPNRFYRARSD